MIDFKLIGTGEDFELFCEDLLQAKGLTIIRRPSRGPDSGADIIASTSGKDALGFDQESRILVECKHYARSGRSVRESDVGSIIERTVSNNCNKYLLVTSTIPSVTLAKQIQAISSNPSIPITATFWCKNDVERHVEANIGLIKRYFSSYENLVSVQGDENDSEHVIAVHLHPDFSTELQELIESWNTNQQHVAFIPIRPPRELEIRLLSKVELDCEEGKRLAKVIKSEAGFSERNGIIVFCEGRLFSEGWHQLFSWTTPFNNQELDCSIISLNVKRQLVSGSEFMPERFTMVVQSMLYALGVSAGLETHDVTRTCIMDFNNEMSDILLGIKHGPKFCPICKRLLQEKHNHLLDLAEIARKFVHEEKTTSRVPIRMKLRDQRQKNAEEHLYDVALSFAGEDRAYAEALASALKQRGIRVFYDDFEKDRLWGEDLYTYLDELYRFKAIFCVVFLSENYATKLWTNHERESAQSKAFLQNRPYILPIRLDNTEIPGIRPTVAYLTWSNESAESIADILVKKLKNDN